MLRLVPAIFVTSILLFAPVVCNAQLGTFDDLRLKGPAPDIVFASNDNSENRFRLLARVDGESWDIDSPTADCVVRIFKDTKGGMLMLNPDDITMAQPLFIEADTGTLTDLLRLENTGDVGMQMINSATGNQFTIRNASSHLEVFNGAGVNLRIKENASDRALTIGEVGVGIGLETPETALHILADGFSSNLESANIRCEVTNDLPAADRSLIQLRNNGGIVMDFQDTSTSPVGQYQIKASSDRFSIQQFANDRAGLVLFEDGAVRFVAKGQPNLTVTGNGNLNVVGSGPGGGNLRVGLGTLIGENDGNLFVKRNISFGGELNGPSDRNIKENFKELDHKEILRKVANLPITRWNYIEDGKKTSHVGPMAQDFLAAFNVGASDKTICMMDSDGVSFSAIKGLSQIVDEKEERISEQELEIVKLKKQLEDQANAISELTAGLERLESIVAPTSN